MIFQSFLKFSILDACQKGIDKQQRPRSDCFWRSSLIGVFPACYWDNHFVNSSPDSQLFIREQKEKSVKELTKKCQGKAPLRNFYGFFFWLNHSIIKIPYRKKGFCTALHRAFTLSGDVSLKRDAIFDIVLLLFAFETCTDPFTWKFLSKSSASIVFILGPYI